MKENDLVGKKVVSMADGAEVGTVKDLIFQELELTALVLAGQRGEGLLPFKGIGSNGPDAITIESYKLVDWNAGKALEPESRSAHDLRKLRVIDGHGNMLGHMHDVTMDDDGHVRDIGVRTDGVFGLGSHETVVSASQVRAFGPDMITVEPKPKP